MKTNSCIFLFTLSFSLIYAVPLWANVPPPPANQTIGINDSLFNDMDEDQCRVCHGTDENVERHHLLYDTEIPDPTDAPYGTPGELYTCLSCHEIDSSSGVIEFLVERDCVVCHIQSSSFELSVHHRTDEALGNPPLDGPDCQSCHGSLVDNIGDGHYIPSHPSTPRTPSPSGGDGLPLNSEGNGAGACDYCHSTGTGDPTIPGIDDATGVSVYSNEDLHHETGFWGGVGAHGFVCYWCHDQSLPPEEQIRVCENCHGMDSLHNIAVDGDGDGIITPGEEPPGYSHVGSDEDCWGCHGFESGPRPGSGATIPFITSTSTNILTAGTDTQVILTGSSFTNLDGDTELASNLVLKADDGTEMELNPDTISAGFLTATVPGTLPTGNYRTRAVKDMSASNPVVLSIIPPVEITTVDCNESSGVLTITGTGFGDPPPEGTDEYINVIVGNTTAESTSWSDTEIQALASSCPGGRVTVNALYGSASSCDCEGNFDGDSDVDGSDAHLFKTDFGRSLLRDPCGSANPCNGDFDCDQDVDGTDAVLMKEDFGRSSLNNPCSVCVVEEWCSY